MPTTDRLTTIKGSGFIWLPPDRTRPKWKVVIGGIEITNDCISGRVKKDVGAIDFFNLIVANGDEKNIGKYTSTWTGGEDVSIYMDYNEPTTKIFQGKLEKNKKSLSKSGGAIINLAGRAFPELADDNTRTIILNETLGHEAIIQVIIDLNTVYKRTVITASLVSEGGHVEKTSETISLTLTGTHIQMLKKICEKLRFNFYVDTNGILYCFTKGKNKNDDETIVEGVNLVSVSNFGFDLTTVNNEINLIGQEKEGCLVLWTSSDITNQNKFWRKAKKVTDTAADSRINAKDLADLNLQLSLLYDNEGSLICDGLPTLMPGQSIHISSQYCGIQGYIEVPSIDFRFSKTGGFETSVVANQQINTLSKIFKTEVSEREKLSKPNNFNNMKYCYHFTFAGATNAENNILEVSGVEVSNSFLKIKSGVDTGYFISIELTLPETVTVVEARLTGESIDDSKVSVSLDGSYFQELIGITFDGEPSLLNILVNHGTKLRVKVELNNKSATLLAMLNSIVVLARP